MLGGFVNISMNFVIFCHLLSTNWVSTLECQALFWVKWILYVKLTNKANRFCSIKQGAMMRMIRRDLLFRELQQTSLMR